MSCFKLKKVILEENLQNNKKFTEREILPFFSISLFSSFRKFQLKEIYSKNEIKHFFLPRKGVMNSFVVEKNNKVTDFISFYTLRSSILNNPKHETLHVT